MRRDCWIIRCSSALKRQRWAAVNNQQSRCVSIYRNAWRTMFGNFWSRERTAISGIDCTRVVQYALIIHRNIAFLLFRQREIRANGKFDKIMDVTRARQLRIIRNSRWNSRWNSIPRTNIEESRLNSQTFAYVSVNLETFPASHGA